MSKKIQELIKVSKKVILDCAMKEGGIIAANSTDPEYSNQAKNYFYVWPRDASFACLAADILEIKDIQENFFNWISKKAENWKKTGLLYEKYYPNGSQALPRLQPDQTGTVLMALYAHFKNNPKDAEKYKKLITHSADGIRGIWEKDHFNLVANDLWEERLAFPDIKDNFTYSLSACVKGLESADKLFPNKKYIKTAREMKNVLLKAAKKRGHFFRTFGMLNDERIDASLLGLIWPFEIVKPDSALAKKTVKLIEKKLTNDFKVYRYENDEYDGWLYKGEYRRKGAGFWPLLNFWMAIVLEKSGQKKKALNYYATAVNSLTSNFIPEQIFDNKIQKSISPLCWSHAMFVLASKELKLI